MYYAHLPGASSTSGMVGLTTYQQLHVGSQALVAVPAASPLIGTDAFVAGQAYVVQPSWDNGMSLASYGVPQQQWGAVLPPAQMQGMMQPVAAMVGPMAPPSRAAHQHGYRVMQQHPMSDMRVPATVEDMMVVLRQLPAGAPAIPAVAAGLRFLDSRALAALLKDLSKCRRAHMASEIFNWLRAVDPVVEPQLAGLLDVYTYTTMIAQCTKSSQLPLALSMVGEMRARGVTVNNHTYSAILNVCVKSNELDLALDVFQQMLEKGLSPNIVTYNILLEVYAKKAMWQEALATLAKIQAQRMDPEVRTYTLVMLACNAGHQYQHTVRLFKEMSSTAKPPNTGAYNAVILAYCKLGEYGQAQHTYHRMVASGCDCTHTTYILMLQAAEENAQWQFSLQLIRDMQEARVRVTPVAYSAAVGACIAAGQLPMANQVLSGLNSSNKSGMVAPTHLMISLYAKCCDWRTAHQVYGKLLASSVRPDVQTLTTLVEAMWQAGTVPTGLVAMMAFEDMCKMGLLRLRVNVEHSLQQAEFYLPVHTPSMVLIAFWRLCNELKARVAAEGEGVLRQQVLVRVGSGTQDLDAQVAPLLEQLCLTQDFPLSITSTSNNGLTPSSSTASTGSNSSSSYITLQGSAAAFAAWLSSARDQELSPYSAQDMDGNQPEQLLELQANCALQCSQAYRVVVLLEEGYPTEGLPLAYVQARQKVWQQLQSCAEVLQPGSAVVAFDAMCLMDRVVYQRLLRPDHSNLTPLVAASLHVVLQSAASSGPASIAQLQQLLDVEEGELLAAADGVRTLLQDTSLMSCYRVATLLLEGVVAGVGPTQQPIASHSALHRVLRYLAAAPNAAGLPPSLVAALAMYVTRKSQGLWPYWPRALLAVTGMMSPVVGHEALIEEALRVLREGYNADPLSPSGRA